MAKMFYTLAEAAQRLGMSQDEVKAMISTNQLQEFRDGGEIKLKVDQVDLLVSHDSDGIISLADSSELEPISLSSSGSSYNANDGGERTGISIFDPEGDAEVDPSAATQVAATGGGVNSADFNFGSAAASGSGLANIALDADDTSLGADLLEDVYGGDPAASGGPASDSGMGGSAALEAGGDLFESPAGVGDAAAPVGAVGVAMLAEPYDGPGSGLVGGLAFGMAVTLLVAATIVILAMSGAASVLFAEFTMNYVYIAVGGGLLLTLIGGGVGWALLRKG